MPDSTSQTFFRELDKKLWTTAAKLPAGTEILGERTRLACSDGRPAGRSSSSKPY